MQPRAKKVAGAMRPLALLAISLMTVLLGSQAAGAGPSQPETELEAFLKKVEAKARAVSSFTCNFSQERHLAIFSKPVLFRGRLAIVRPYRLRWEVTDPLPSVLIFTETRGLRCSGNSAPQQFDLTTDPVMRLVAQQLRTWMDADYGELRALYGIELSGITGIVLRPTDARFASMIASITIIFDPVLLHPVKVEIREPGGDLTVISFRDYQLNIPPDESLFTNCNAP